MAELKPQLADFKWQDPFLLENQLSEDDRMLRDAAAQFAQTELQPLVIDAYREATVSPELFPKMGEAGLLGATIPEEYGGFGASYTAYGLIAREIERVDSGYRSMMSVQSSLVIYPIHAYGSEEQRKKFLPGLCSGALIGCFGLTESDAGSDPSGMKTRAVKTATGYRITGSKMWISNAPIADVFVVWAKSEEHGGKIRGFILEKGMKGLTAPKIGGKLSLRASVTGEIVMDDVEVGEGSLLPNVQGFKGPFGCLNRARYGIAWGVMGAAEFCWHSALQYGQDRAVLTILQCGVPAKFSRPHNAPCNAVTGTIETAKRTFEALNIWQERAFTHLNIIHNNLTGDRSPQRQLAANFWGGQALHAFFKDKSTNFAAMLFRFGPNNEDICNWCV